MLDIRYILLALGLGAILLWIAWPAIRYGTPVVRGLW